MTDTELLAATGNAWKVYCYRDANHRKPPVVHFIRATTKQGAESAGKSYSGLRYAIAHPYDPTKDLAMLGYIRRSTP